MQEHENKQWHDIWDLDYKVCCIDNYGNMSIFTSIIHLFLFKGIFLANNKIRNIVMKC